MAAKGTCVYAAGWWIGGGLYGSDHLAFEELLLKSYHCNHSRMAMRDCSIELHIDYDNEGITSRRVSVFGYEWNEKRQRSLSMAFATLDRVKDLLTQER